MSWRTREILLDTMSEVIQPAQLSPRKRSPKRLDEVGSGSTDPFPGAQMGDYPLLFWHGARKQLKRSPGRGQIKHSSLKQNCWRNSQTRMFSEKRKSAAIKLGNGIE
jgi:hypothetical protein